VKFSIIVDILLTFHMMRCHLTGNEAAQAVSMLQAGQVQRAVAGHFNVSQSVISRLWNRFQHTGNVAERPRSGRPVMQLPIHMVSCPLQACCSVFQGQYGMNCWSVGTQISCMQSVSDCL
jgi:hypothetical protein